MLMMNIFFLDWHHSLFVWIARFWIRLGVSLVALKSLPGEDIMSAAALSKPNRSPYFGRLVVYFDKVTHSFCSRFRQGPCITSMQEA